MRSCRRFAVAAGVTALAALSTPPASAQQPATGHASPATLEAAAPIRYDTDYLPAAFHRGRREAVRSSLPADAVALVFSAPKRNRSADVDYEFRQSNDLYYLTGAQEPGTALLMAPAGVEVDGRRVQEILFVREPEPMRELWTGRGLGPEEAEELLGVELALGLSRFEEVVGPLLAERRLFHLPLPDGLEKNSDLARQLAFVRNRASMLEASGPHDGWVLRWIFAASTDAEVEESQPRVRRLLESGRLGTEVRRLAEAFAAAPDASAWRAWRDENLSADQADGTTLRATLDALRAVKTPEELTLLRRAIEATVAAHREALRSIEPGMHEYEVEAVIEYVFQKLGAEEPGFPSIVGSGENSVVLHYESNRRRMEAGDLVVMDIGAEYRGYTADVTRTAPVDGTFTPEQRAVYELVLRAQEAAIREARPGASFGRLEEAAREVLGRGLVELGLLRSAADLHRFSMHGFSHYLGLDVHDVGPYGRLEEGNVITVEPGVYIRPAADVDSRWWYIGVRIEDDVLVTDGDPVVLSERAPKSVAEVEALMRETGIGNLPAGS